MNGMGNIVKRLLRSEGIKLQPIFTRQILSSRLSGKGSFVHFFLQKRTEYLETLLGSNVKHHFRAEMPEQASDKETIYEFCLAFGASWC